MHGRTTLSGSPFAASRKNRPLPSQRGWC